MERVRTLLARHFADRGFGVEFVLFQAQGELLYEAEKVAGVVGLRALRFRDGFWPLVTYLRRERPAAVLVAMWPLTGLAALAKLVARSNCTLIVSEHNALSHTPAYRGWSRRIHRRFGRWIYSLTDGVVCVSQGVRDDIHAATGLPLRHLHVIYNPVRRPAAGAAPADAAITGWSKSGGVSLLSIGSLKPQKDWPTLLRAFADLRKSRAAHLLILGEGALRAELEELVITLGLQDSVLMPGFVPDPYPYLAQADLFVLSSAWEGLGNVITEALVAGVPVVSTDCPSGPAEILDYGKFGRLVPVGDPQAMAMAIVEELGKTHDREALRRRGAEFSIERAADQYLALLDPNGKLRAAT